MTNCCLLLSSHLTLIMGKTYKQFTWGVMPSLLKLNNLEKTVTGKFLSIVLTRKMNSITRFTLFIHFLE